eukprot:6202697-Pleurochrysis_carterae.AAC.1
MDSPRSVFCLHDKCEQAVMFTGGRGVALQSRNGVGYELLMNEFEVAGGESITVSLKELLRGSNRALAGVLTDLVTSTRRRGAAAPNLHVHNLGAVLALRQGEPPDARGRALHWMRCST